MIESVLPRHLQIFRLLPLNLLLKLVSHINHKMNVTKEPVVSEFNGISFQVHLNYHDKYKNKINKHVCDWNAGIYTGIGKYTGATDIIVTEIECLTKGDSDCVFDIKLNNLSYTSRFYIFMHSILDPTNVKKQDIDNLSLNDIQIRLEGIVDQRTQKLREANSQLLKEIENRRKAETARINAEKAAAIAEYGRSMGGALAHEIGNSTQTSAFRINAMDTITKDENGNSRSLEMVLEEKIAQTASALFELEKHGMAREIIIKHIMPHLQEIDRLREYTFQSVNILKQTIGRDMKLAQKFLEYSKMGEIKRGIDLINLSELLNTLNMCYTPDLEKNNIDMIISMENDMDISGDYTQLESVFSNLIKNAIEAFEGTNITNRVIKISGKRISKENGKYIQVSVSDNGKGIPKEQQKDIFKPFKTSKPTKGTGLGLNLAQRIVNAYGGSIKFKSKNGQITKFNVYIKLLKN